MAALTDARVSHRTGCVPMETRRRRIKESIDNWAFGHAFSTALRRHLRHRPLESFTPLCFDSFPIESTSIAFISGLLN